MLRHKVLYSLPVQLLINHIKKNQVMLLVWLVLTGFITSSFGKMLGIPYLFLDPEYMNSAEPKSMLILGVAFGIFNMSFQITSYILDSNRFSFIGMLKYPFIKFIINNSVIPLLFTIIYLYCFITFQINSGFQDIPHIVLEAIAFLVGAMAVQILIAGYFRFSNKDIFKLLATNLNTQFRKNKFNRVNVLKTISSSRKQKYRVEYYYEFPFQWRSIDKDMMYDKQAVIKIFDQNHLNAVFIEALIFVIIIVLGQLNDIPFFQIPAGASAFIFCAMVVMLTGAFSYWLRGWAITTVVVMIVLANILMQKNILKLDNEVFGINYMAPKADYSIENITQLSSDKNYLLDRQNTTYILENWRRKFPIDKKPKMVFICTSGGGQRAALWSVRTLQVIDESTNGKLMNHSMLMTGASGGLIGAAYFRELYLRKKQGTLPNLYDEQYMQNISKDVLNPVLFSFFVNDIFFRVRNFKIGEYTYTKDRGYAFELQLNRNTAFVMDRGLMGYARAEQTAQIPMLILSPTIVNDGRKLYISPQNISYMCTAELSSKHNMSQRVKGIEFRRMYESQSADSLRFMSALRMSATFPYITPNITLPSSPTMEVMDAGLSDNFGITDAARFLYVFKDWVAKNTSGVIFVSIRDSPKEVSIQKKEGQSIFEKFLNPIGSLYNNWDYLQDINNDNLIDYARGWFPGTVDVVDFQYIPKSRYWEEIIKRNISHKKIEKKEREERASLSWHLTTREKESMKITIHEANNQASLRKLQRLLEMEY